MVIPDIPNQNLAGSQSSACEKTSLESNQSATASARVQKKVSFVFTAKGSRVFLGGSFVNREERRDPRTSFLLCCGSRKRKQKNPVTY